MNARKQTFLAPATASSLRYDMMAHIDFKGIFNKIAQLLTNCDVILPQLVITGNRLQCEFCHSSLNGNIYAWRGRRGMAHTIITSQHGPTGRDHRVCCSALPRQRLRNSEILKKSFDTLEQGKTSFIFHHHRAQTSRNHECHRDITFQDAVPSSDPEREPYQDTAISAYL